MNKELSSKQSADLLATLKARFEENPERHPSVEWAEVEKKLSADPAKQWILHEMERTDGQPDVMGVDEKTRELIFYDCSPESPQKRRSLCYDREALNSRKEHRPLDSVMDMASAMGVEVLDESEYRVLQKSGKFDAKTSSWLKTPESIRKLGGAIFGDFRYGNVFIYHNGAQSYYASRGFRGKLKV